MIIKSNILAILISLIGILCLTSCSEESFIEPIVNKNVSYYEEVLNEIDDYNIDKQKVLNSLHFDDSNRLITFSHSYLQQSLNSLEYIRFLMDMTKSNVIYINDQIYSRDLQDKGTINMFLDVSEDTQIGGTGRECCCLGPDCLFNTTFPCPSCDSNWNDDEEEVEGDQEGGGGGGGDWPDDQDHGPDEDSDYIYVPVIHENMRSSKSGAKSFNQRVRVDSDSDCIVSIGNTCITYKKIYIGDFD